MLLRTVLRHDSLHNSLTKRVLGGKDQIVACATSFLVLESEWKHIFGTQFLQSFDESLHDGCLALFWWQSSYLLPQSLCSLFAEQHVNVLLHGLVVQPHVDAVVVEKENAVAAPVFDDRVD